MYLSRGEREHYLIGLAAYENLDMWLNDERNQINKEEAKNLKTARTYIKKGLNLYANRIDKEQFKRITTDAKGHNIAIVPKRVVECEEEIRVKTEDLYDTMNYVLYYECRSCHEKSYKKCRLYQAMMDMRIPVAEIDPKGCPYKQEV